MPIFKEGHKVYLNRLYGNTRSIAHVVQTEGVPTCRFCKLGEAVYVRTWSCDLLHVHKADIELYYS